jgi:hypothetical protein
MIRDDKGVSLTSRNFMRIKDTISGGVMAVVLAFASYPVLAKTSAHQGLGISPLCYSHSSGPGCGYRYGYTPNPRVGFYHRRTDRSPFRPQYYPLPQVSCGEAQQIVRRSGFSNIRVRGCGGITSSFVGQKRGHLWIVNVSTRNGRLIGAHPVAR